MRQLQTICAALLFCIATPILADANSHAAEARRFLELTRVDRLTVPAYAQVRQMFAQRFAQAGGSEAQKTVLERYQAKANAALDKAVNWDKLGPELVPMYTDAFTEAELKQLVAFYQTPLGRKLLERMPQLMAMSAQHTQERLRTVAPEVDRLLGEMSNELKKP